MARRVSRVIRGVNENHAASGLRIGTISTGLHSLLPDILVRFAGTHPKVQIVIHSGTSAKLYAAMRRGEVGTAIWTHPLFAVPKDFAHRIWQGRIDRAHVATVPVGAGITSARSPKWRKSRTSAPGHEDWHAPPRPANIASTGTAFFVLAPIVLF
jgi:DNA-binding transcriptional LysR family regulator